MKRVGIVGAGAWGTALSTVAARAGHSVTIWAHEPEVVDDINANHRNKTFLAGAALDAAIHATGDFGELNGCGILLVVTPAQHTRTVISGLIESFDRPAPLVICSKGIEQRTGELMSEVLAEAAPDFPVAVLSGPTFAHEVAAGLPAAVTLASESEDALKKTVAAIGLPTFRPYTTDDVVGAQIGGSVKNVLAIACGIVEGRELGENARAALITRGMAEMMRFADWRGAKRETLMGLCGIGDLILTCSSLKSRNMSLGYELGRGRSMEDIMGERKTVAEGAHTAEVLHRIATDEGLDMPIVASVHDVLYSGESVAEAIEGLLQRPFARESD